MDVRWLMETLVAAVAPASLIAWSYGKYRGRTVTRRITAPDDTDLDDALELYEGQFGDTAVRDTGHDMRRWLTEEQDASQDSGEPPSIVDVIIIAKKAGRVCGFCSAQFFPRNGTLFFSYLVADESGVTEKIAAHFRRIFRRELRTCTAIAFELQRPNPGSGEAWESRFRRFQRLAKPLGITIRRLGFQYRQPRLSLWDAQAVERDQLLFYGRLGTPVGGLLRRDELIPLLDTLYNDWYGQSYEDDPRHNAQYRAYVRTLFDTSVVGLPEWVPTYDRARPDVRRDRGGPQ